MNFTVKPGNPDQRRVSSLRDSRLVPPRLRLPFPGAVAGAVLHDPEQVGEPGPSAKSVRILIVDDDSDVLRPLWTFD